MTCSGLDLVGGGVGLGAMMNPSLSFEYGNCEYIECVTSQ